jgi:hypothetical protein
MRDVGCDDRPGVPAHDDGEDRQAPSTNRIRTSSGGTILLILMIDEANSRPLDLRDSGPISRQPSHGDRNRIEPTASDPPEQFRGDAGTLDRHFRSPVPCVRRKSPIVDRTLASPPKGEVHAVVDEDHVACAVGDVDEHIHRS